MLDQQNIKSRQIVADYKKHNKNTIEVISDRPNAKTWVFKRVQTDENASKFSAKQKNASEVEKREKRAKKAPKESVAKVKKAPKPFVRKSTATYFKVVKLFKEGLLNREISDQLGVTMGAVQNHVREYHKEKGLKVILKRGKSKSKKVIERRNQMYLDYKKGMGFNEMAEKYGISKQVCSKDIQTKLAELGEERRDFKSEKRDLCYKLFSQLKTNAFIADTYNIPRSTVGWHRKKYNESKKV